MALTVRVEGNKFCVQTPAFCTDWLPDTAMNRHVTIVWLRQLLNEKGKPWFKFKELAGIVRSTNAQAASQHVEDFRACGEEFQAFIQRQRKVDRVVVECVRKELLTDPLMKQVELVQRVNEQLADRSLSFNNISAALATIPCTEVLDRLGHQLVSGKVHYQEEYLLETALTALAEEDGKKRSQAVSVLAAAVTPDPVEGMSVMRPAESTLADLLTVDKRVEEIPLAVRWVVFCMLLYSYGVPLRVLGQWLGVHKTTILRWIVGLCEGLCERIEPWIIQRVKGTVVYLDEKWIKVKGKWHYWFVALDAETELPIVHGLMHRRSRWNCLWILIKLKRAGLTVKVFVTDKLKGYFWAIPRVFKEARHQLCLFHHQQNVTAFAKEHFSDATERQRHKKAMKKVFQTHDKRTVRNRLAQLQTQTDKPSLIGWAKEVLELLPHLLPAVGSRRIPSTNNAIERFFRAFQRFYKIRGGFYSIASAQRQLILFLIFYLFTRGEEGRAPIERIMPEARRMPLYQLMNDPFRSLRLGSAEVQRVQRIAHTRVNEAT